LANLTAIFGATPEKPADNSDKLRELYWNRAELKKELARLRDDKYQLQECIQQKEGASVRLLQKLEYLESLLLDPATVYNVIVYFQFRNLNLQCKSKLANFAEYLKQQREQRVQSGLLADWNELRAEEASAVEKSIGEHRFKTQMLEDQLQSEQHKLKTSNGLLRLFRRRSMARAVQATLEATQVAERHETDLMMKFDEIQKRIPPDTQGLNLETKRLINFMILSYAQQLFLHFSESGLAAMSQEVGEKSVGSINYGSKSDCDELLVKIAAQIESYEKSTDFADILRRRAALIAKKALFRCDDDAVPEADSVATLYVINEDGKVQQRDANLLGGNYWDVAKILSR
jgi:hypothetical protein